MHHTSDHFYLISRLLDILLLLLLIQLTASRSATSVTALALSCLPNLLYNPCTPGIIESYLVWILLLYHPCYAQAWWILMKFLCWCIAFSSGTSWRPAQEKQGILHLPLSALSTLFKWTPETLQNTLQEKTKHSVHSLILSGI